MPPVLRESKRSTFETYLTPSEFSERLGIKRSRTYQWIRRGLIEAMAFGDGRHPSLLIPKTELVVGKEIVRKEG